MDKPIEMGKLYTSRGGTKIRIYAIDGSGIKSVHGAVLFPFGWSSYSWSSHGFFYNINDTCYLDIVSEYVEPKDTFVAWQDDKGIVILKDKAYVAPIGWTRIPWLDQPESEK